MPSRSAAIQSPFGTRTPDVVPFHRNTMSCLGSACVEIGQRAVIRLEDARVLDLQLLDRVGDPVLAEAFPGEAVDGQRPQHRPHRHLDRAGVRRGHDADAIIGRNAEQRLGAVDRVLQLGFAGLGAMRAPEQAPCRALRWSSPAVWRRVRTKKKAVQGARPDGFPVISHSFQNERASLGRRGPHPT